MKGWEPCWQSQQLRWESFPTHSRGWKAPGQADRAAGCGHSQGNLMLSKKPGQQGLEECGVKALTEPQPFGQQSGRAVLQALMICRDRSQWGGRAQSSP